MDHAIDTTTWTVKLYKSIESGFKGIKNSQIKTLYGILRQKHKHFCVFISQTLGRIRENQILTYWTSKDRINFTLFSSIGCYGNGYCRANDVC